MTAQSPTAFLYALENRFRPLRGPAQPWTTNPRLPCLPYFSVPNFRPNLTTAGSSFFAKFEKLMLGQLQTVLRTPMEGVSLPDGSWADDPLRSSPVLGARPRPARRTRNYYPALAPCGLAYDLKAGVLLESFVARLASPRNQASIAECCSDPISSKRTPIPKIPKPPPECV
jgi:hypothetical protein